MRGLLLLILAATTACAADVEVAVLPYADEAMPRHAYLRRETLRARVRVRNGSDRPLEGPGRLLLTRDGRTLAEVPFRIAVPAGGEAETGAPLALSDFKTAQYRLEATCTLAGTEYSAHAALWICPEPDPEGLVLAMWWESVYKGVGYDEVLDELQALGMTAMQGGQPSSTLLDSCLRHRMGYLAIQEGSAAAAGYLLAPDEPGRLNAVGKPFVSPGFSEPFGQSIANTDWQRATAADLGKRIARMSAYPAFDPRVCTCDDFFRFTGLDYNPRNVERFREMHGIDPPRPPEALQNDFPTQVQRDKGIIPDDDPWVLWLRFCSREVLGHFNRLLTDAVLDGTDGRGKVGPICGGDGGANTVPYVDMASGQWPPYNFGSCGFNLLCSYNYNFYWYPALSQVWWLELGRMGHRDLEQWLMPETMDLRATAHLQNWYLYMAAGVKGLAYFIYERTTPGAREALERIGPVARRYRKLLGALRPAPRTVGLLMPFETACFNARHPVDSLYAFCNLAMAHVEVEPVWPEELPERMSRYDAVLLHNVDWLTRRNMQRLQDYIAQGGTVLCDSLTELEVPGSVRLDFPLAGADRRESYGDLDQVARVKEAVQRHVRPWATSDDPHLLLRRFRAGGVDYLWAVNLMTHGQDIDHVPTPGKEREVELLPAYAGFNRRPYEGLVAIPAENYAVYDVLNGRRLNAVRIGDRLLIPVQMDTWQGCLLALYPSAPSALAVDAPRRGGQGRTIRVETDVLSGRRRLRAPLPLEITVREPDGSVSAEYSHTALAEDGQYGFPLPFATNDAPGRWRITVRELSAGLERSVEIELAAR